MSISYNFLNKNKLYLSANPTYLLILKFFISGKNTNNLWKRRIKRDKCLRNACQ